jgi:hypothetical protein
VPPLEPLQRADKSMRSEGRCIECTINQITNRLMKPIEREIKTVSIMIDIYCRHHHGSDKLCKSCQDLYSYARQRTLKCTFIKDKPTCGKCQTHCYKPNMKTKIRDVMKFSGPKMIYSHPILAIRHLMATLREAPATEKPR